MEEKGFKAQGFPSRYSIEIRQDRNLQGFARVRHFPPLRLDEPPQFHGQDTAPSPMDYLLISVGGCLMNSFAFCLQKKRIPAELSLKVEGVLDRDEEKGLRVKEINCVIHVEVEGGLHQRVEECYRLRETADEYRNFRGPFHHGVEECYRIFKKYCIVSASVGRGIPINTALKIHEKL